MSGISNIPLVRQFQRHEITFEARFEPYPDHADQLRLSLPHAQSIVTITDVSQGGLGFQSTVYIPKDIRLKLSVSDVCKELGQAERTLIVGAIVRVCSMIDYKPTYQVGLQFVDSKGLDERTLVDACLLKMKNHSKQLVGAGGSQ